MAQAQTEAEPIVNRTQALVWLRQMMLIRRFEERAEMLYQKGNKIGGFFHQYSGQEPVAVGSIGVLREDDYLITAYRDHGHALARGMSDASPPLSLFLLSYTTRLGVRLLLHFLRQLLRLFGRTATLLLEVGDGALNFDRHVVQRAARARDQQLVGRYVGDLVAACGNCHSRFATARFPTFETSH